MLYASTQLSGLNVYSYPGLRLLGTMTLGAGELGMGLCSDRNGDVFATITQLQEPNYIFEYVHGGTDPIAELSEGGSPNGCAIDATTGNLAVANWLYASSNGGVVVYRHAKGAPTYYNAAGFTRYYYCAYDDDGNLFASGNGGLAELPKGSGTFTNISLPRGVHPVSIQWNENELVASAAGRNYPQKIWRLRVAGSTATLIGTTLLRTPSKTASQGFVQFEIEGRNIIMPNNNYDSILGIWGFPAGGTQKRFVRMRNLGFGVTLSIAR